MLPSETTSLKVAALLSIFLYPYERVWFLLIPQGHGKPVRMCIGLSWLVRTLADMLIAYFLVPIHTSSTFRNIDLRLEKNRIGNWLEAFQSRCM